MKDTSITGFQCELRDVLKRYIPMSISETVAKNIDVLTHKHYMEFTNYLINNWTFIPSTKDYVIKYHYYKPSNDYKHFSIDEIYEYWLTIK